MLKLSQLIIMLTLNFTTSTGNGIRLSEIKFYNIDNIQLTSVTTNTTQPTNSTLNITSIGNALDGNTSTNWESNGTVGSVTFAIPSTNGMPFAYRFTTTSDQTTNNGTPTAWEC